MASATYDKKIVLYKLYSEYKKLDDKIDCNINNYLNILKNNFNEAKENVEKQRNKWVEKLKKYEKSWFQFLKFKPKNPQPKNLCVWYSIRK